jgi:hypothetical protein
LEEDVSWRSPVPSTRLDQISTSPLRLLSHAMELPSGDYAGLASSAASSVTGTTVPAGPST